MNRKPSFKLRINGRIITRCDAGLSKEFKARIVKMFFCSFKEENKLQFRSASDASTAYAWIKDEYPEYKNRINLSGGVIIFH